MATSLTETLGDAAGKDCFGAEPAPAVDTPCATDLEPSYDFVPNVMIGTMVTDTPASVDTWPVSESAGIQIGLNDFALEGWILLYGLLDDLGATGGAGRHTSGPRLVEWTGTDVNFAAAHEISVHPIGPVSTYGGVPLTHGMVHAIMTDDAAGSYGTIEPVGDPDTEPVGFGWHHYACNYDRNANMELFTDSISIGTNAIGAGVANNLLQRRILLPTAYKSHPQESVNIAVGPCAVHVGTLLTLAQMRDSVHRHYVQNLAATQILYDYRGISGHDYWELRLSRILHCLRQRGNVPAAAGGGYPTGGTCPGVATQGITMGAPAGTQGAVLLPDVSGNGNGLYLPTLPFYGTNRHPTWINNIFPGSLTNCELAYCAFASDPFFK